MDGDVDSIVHILGQGLDEAHSNACNLPYD